MPNDSYDLVILGGGAAGFAAATEADRRGIRTLLVNQGLPMGGTCVNVGCMPTKHLLAAAGALHAARHPRFGSVGASSPAFDFRQAIADKDRLVAGAREANYRNVLQGLRHVTWAEGRGAFVSDHVLRVGDREIRAGQVLIATGCRTRVPPVPGLAEVGYLTNREALALDRLPRSLAVLGGGALGLEFAQLFARFGAEVTVVEAADRILPPAEPEISEALQGTLEAEGVGFRTGAKVVRVERQGDGKRLVLEKGGTEEDLTADEILVATGVTGNIEDLNLDAVGVETQGGFVHVDEHLRTSVAHVWAAGDVTGPPCLETVAAKQGKLAVENAFGGGNKTIDPGTVPYAVFTDPEAAGVGLTEAEYLARHGTCTCRTVPLDRVPRALAVNDARGLVKMIAHHETGRVVGVHILGPHASEIVHEATLAVRFGLTVDDLIDTVHVFPTYSEAIKIAAQAFRRDITRMSCCVE
ncbi:mercury(II) reductase [Deferrisoma camini]|uniref:mercury(II) reductase n=1 Tax=Deferrisoma camini TaxID=1035120 RepID=UPI00046D6D51|nr:mercury(II) reductase [Deferrisoma camini]